MGRVGETDRVNFFVRARSAPAGADPAKTDQRGKARARKKKKVEREGGRISVALLVEDLVKRRNQPTNGKNKAKFGERPARRNKKKKRKQE